jgi:predicted nucleotidyltransferase
MVVAPDIPALVRWLETEPGVVAVWLFGSRARGDARPDSDVDLAVLTGTGLVDGAGAARPDGAEVDQLRLRLGWMIEAADRMKVRDDKVDLVLLPDAGAFLTHEILRDGQLLVDRDRDARIGFQVRALHRLEEARYLRELAMRARAERFGVSP